ncbi:methyl-accepting chemotaxis protein McpA [Clostridium acetireducens DSM 10703]|uniref:Methyl-accepting chemotaxis protein McpA n=1 Tax=Clostridium acetireducens DSM 10703 TaxID=1121290 RepID=A0A1E8EY59_9CLOT|nr:methyl-accepting chemotaxis protein [Clostridium acetireducens]OFI05889.1 methyl-accepting chemotaxis protein McpA [Clostridium acetireducens DSM 10703]
MRNNLLKNRSIKFKVLTVPLSIFVIVLLLICTLSSIMIKERLLNQVKTEGTHLGTVISSQMTKSSKAVDVIDENIEDRIITLAEFLNVQGDKINNNEYLKQVCRIFKVDEVNVADKNGKIIYSNIPSSIGREVKTDNVGYVVLSGKKNSVMEKIRKSQNDENYYKYGYVKKNNGGLFQIGILANKIEKLNSSLKNQTILEEIAKSKNIVYAAVVDKNLKITSHSDRTKIDNSIDKKNIEKVVKQGENITDMYYYKEKGEKVFNVIVPIYKDGVREGALDLGLSLENTNKAIIRVITLISIIGVIALIAAVFVLLNISKDVTNPLKDIVLVSQKIAEGELDNTIEVDGKDEIGVLGRNFAQMSSNLRQSMIDIKEQTNKVEEMSSQLNANSQQMTSVTNEVTNAVQEVTKGATEQANDLVEIVNSVEDLSKEVQNIHNKLKYVKDSSETTESKANVGKEQINVLLKSIEDIKSSFQVVVDKVNNLNESVSQVGNITEVINGISEQTNLLALNAAIEAARAGEAGKGFAVVAEEVRKLAEMSKESTDKIQNLVQAISAETGNVIQTSNEVNGLVEGQVNIVEKSVLSFNDILDSISQIAPFIEETYESLKNTLTSKDIVSSKVEAVTAVSQENSASAEEISASSEEVLANSEEVSRHAEELNEVADKLGEATNKFKI